MAIFNSYVKLPEGNCFVRYRVDRDGASECSMEKNGRCSATKEEDGTSGVSVASAKSRIFMDFQSLHMFAIFCPYPNTGTPFDPMADQVDHFVPNY